MGGTISHPRGPMADEFARDMFRVFNMTHVQSTEHRTVAIVAAAYIDDHLTGLIKKKLPGLDSTLSKRLFEDVNASLGNLASKIDIARALEVINAPQRAEAVLIARIRNRFAHYLDVDSFDHPQVAALVDRFAAGRGVMMHRDGFEPVAFDHDWTREQRFCSAAVGLCTTIMMLYQDGAPLAYKLAPEDVPAPSRTKPVEIPRSDQEVPDQADQ